MLDTKHPESKLSQDGGRYAVTCDEHETRVRFEKHVDAGRALAHVDEWCEPCKAMIAAGEKAKASRVTEAVPEPAVSKGRRRAASTAKES